MGPQPYCSKRSWLAATLSAWVMAFLDWAHYLLYSRGETLFRSQPGFGDLRCGSPAAAGQVGVLPPWHQTLSASVVERRPPDAVAWPHFQPVMSGMSSPWRAMYSLCSMSLSRMACFA